MGYPVAIVVYFPTPTDDRETTERRARVLLRDFFAQIFA